MKKFERERVYRIGQLEQGTRATASPPKFKGGKYVSSFGKQLIGLGMKTVADLFTENPLGLPVGKNYHVFEVDPNGELEYFGEGYIAKPTGGLADDEEPKGREENFRSRGGGTRRILENYQSTLERMDSTLEQSRYMNQGLMDELRAERDDKEDIIDRVIAAERRAIEAQEELKRERTIWELEKKWQKDIEEIKEAQRKREEKAQGLADDLGIKEIIREAVPALVGYLTERMSGGHQPMSQPAPQHAPDGEALSDMGEIRRSDMRSSPPHDMGIQKVEPIQAHEQNGVMS